MPGGMISIPLGPLDHIPPRNYFKTVLYLPLKSGTGARQAYDHLHDGLHRTFLQAPWLSGKVHWQPRDAPGWRPGQLEIRYNELTADGPKPNQLKFNELRAAPPYSEIKDAGFPADTFTDEELLCAPFLADVDSGADVFVAQANFIPGACLLGFTICHPASDGTAMVTIIDLWAKNCKKLHVPSQHGSIDFVKEGQPTLLPGSSDRGLPEKLWIKQKTGHERHEIDASSFRLFGLSPPGESQGESMAASLPPQSPTVRASVNGSGETMHSSIFYISPSEFASLQKECAEASGSGELTGNDIVCALIWRALMKARAAAKVAAGTGDIARMAAELEMTVDGRPMFNGMPGSYLGNVILISQPSIPVLTLVAAETSVAAVAQVIRDSARTVNHETAMDGYALLREVSGYGEVKLRFTTIEGSSLLITSLVGFPLDQVSFGAGKDGEIFENDGKIESFRPLMGGFNRLFRTCMVLPRTAQGGIEFVVSLFDDEMELLLEDDEFGRYALQLA
ncbi:putative Transferase family protein [Seiridium cardinale]|uniref:Transferase family protein n=1 Tax=Seiridium cardinale TaxID=138064 RepID=A0ABR2XMF1_9PEZI